MTPTSTIQHPRLGMLATIRFLGYNPMRPPPGGLCDRLVSCRTLLGLSQKVFAGQLGVDQGTLARWERGEREPKGTFAVRVSRFLSTTEAAWAKDTARTA
jgi:DNA-binding XRE family transcriptional regulator